MITLDSRLAVAAKLCRHGVTVCDVGTDHAQLACYLADDENEVIACDINDGPLEAARRTVAQYDKTNVRVLKSDGLKEIDYADDVVICGMGGELIADIISGCRFLSGDTRFILQPMTKAEILRRRLYENGFEIIEEHTAYEGKRAYVIMLVGYTGKNQVVDEMFAFCGKVTDSRYLSLIAEKIEKNAHGMARSENCSGEAQRLSELAAEIRKRSEGNV